MANIPTFLGIHMCVCTPTYIQYKTSSGKGNNQKKYKRKSRLCIQGSSRRLQCDFLLGRKNKKLKDFVLFWLRDDCVQPSIFGSFELCLLIREV